MMRICGGSSGDECRLRGTEMGGCGQKGGESPRASMGEGYELRGLKRTEVLALEEKSRRQVRR